MPGLPDNPTRDDLADIRRGLTRSFRLTFRISVLQQMRKLSMPVVFDSQVFSFIDSAWQRRAKSHLVAERLFIRWTARKILQECSDMPSNAAERSKQPSQ